MGSVLYECTSTLLVTRLNNEQSCRVAYVLFRDVVRDVEFDYVCMYVVLSSGRAGVHKTSKGRGDRGMVRADTDSIMLLASVHLCGSSPYGSCADARPAVADTRFYKLPRLLSPTHAS